MARFSLPSWAFTPSAVRRHEPRARFFNGLLGSDQVGVEVAAPRRGCTLLWRSEVLNANQWVCVLTLHVDAMIFQQLGHDHL